MTLANKIGLILLLSALGLLLAPVNPNNTKDMIRQIAYIIFWFVGCLLFLYGKQDNEDRR